MKKGILFIIILIIECMALEGIYAQENTIVTRKYWKLPDGYDATFTNDMTLTISQTEFGETQKKNAYEMVFTGFPSRAYNYDREENLLKHGGRWTDGSFYIYDPERPVYLDNELEIDKTYALNLTTKEFDTNGFVNGYGNHNIEMTLTGPEQVVVAPDTYTTYRLTEIIDWEDSWGRVGKTTYVYWLAKNIGIVKFSSEGTAYELQQINNPLPPAAPQNLKAEIKGLELILSWDDVSSADGYLGFADPSQLGLPFDGAYEYQQIDLDNITSVSVDLWEGACFYAAVQAYNTAGTSDYSNIIFFYIPKPPKGHVDIITEDFVAGWAFDPKDTNREIDVHIYVDGTLIGSTTANSERSGLLSAFPDITNPNHGFKFEFLNISTGKHLVGVYAINTIPDGPNPLLPPGQQWVNVKRIFTNNIGQSFVLIHAGTFTMGSPGSLEEELVRDHDETQHDVTLTEPFYIQTTEVTQAQWEAVMEEEINPSHNSGCPDCPVEMVDWNDAQSFVEALNRLEGTDKYRLPTEAEWEYAARAGSTTAFAYGDITEPYGSDPDLDEIGWYEDNSENRTHPVAQKQPNAWWLYDMHGNVWEWIQDWYGDYTSGTVTDPQGPSDGNHRVLRGGSYLNAPKYARCAERHSLAPGQNGYNIGFRLVRTY